MLTIHLDYGLRPYTTWLNRRVMLGYASEGSDGPKRKRTYIS